LTFFLLGSAALLALVTLLVMLPTRRAATIVDENARANREWLALRQRELANEPAAIANALTDDARLRVIEDMDQAQPDPGVGPAERVHFPRWPLPLVIGGMGIWLYYSLGAAPDVVIGAQIRAVEEAVEAPPVDIPALVASIERRSAARPDNLQYLSLLARIYMSQENYPLAAEAYDRLAERIPGDPEVQAMAAQASFLAFGRKLDAQNQLRAENALALDPGQTTALGLLGMAAFERGQYRAAIDYWERLLAVEPPGSPSAEVLTDVIQRARSALADAGGEVPPARELPAPVDEGVTVAVRIAMPPGARAAPTDTVFVLARSPETDSRMPIAVRRLTVAQLPTLVVLGDGDSMAGQALSTTPEVKVFVQISPSGQPGEANASYAGETAIVSPVVGFEPVDIRLSPR